MTKRLFKILLLICLIAVPTTAYADIGPKPSVNIEIEGIDTEYYVTLLSETESTGPYSAVGAFSFDNADYFPGDDGYEIWKKFVEYEDYDGYYFLQYFQECSETDNFRWGYYPPSKFKVLIYYPQNDVFAVSEIYERYAFDSYYKINAQDLNVGERYENTMLIARKNYNYTLEIVSMLARIALTVIIETAVAFLFAFRSKKQLKVILGVNIITQTILNVLLNISNYKGGHWMFVFNYVWMELMVLLIEFALFYLLLRDKDGNRYSKKRIFAYSAAANVISFGAGLLIAMAIPGIF